MLSEDKLIEARHKLSAGRIIAIRMLPYFETTLMAMVTMEMPGFGKFTVDKRWRFYYDPELCLTMTTQEIAAEWIHNVEHIVRKHEERFASLEGHTHDHKKYNAAADGAINSDLKEQGIIMPNPDQQFYAEPNPQFPTWKKNMSAEEMYFSAGGGGSTSDPVEDVKNGGKSEDDSDPGESSGSSDNSTGGEGPDAEDEESEASDDTRSSSSEEDAEMPAEGLDGSDEGEDSSKADKDSENPSKAESGGDTSDPEGNPEDSDASDNEGVESKDNKGDSSEDIDHDGSESDESGDDGEIGNGSSEDDEESGDDGEDDDSEFQLENSGSAEGVQQIGDTASNDEHEDGSDEGDGDTPSTGPAAPGNGEEKPGDTNSKPLPDCGSAVGGPKREYESNDEDDGSVDDLSADTLLKKTAEAIQAYADSNPGKVPGGLLREAKNILEPQIDWVDEFLSMFRAVTAKHSGYANYSYSRPSRRSSGSAFILPVMRNPPAPEVAIVLDTSGSMDEGKEIAMALAEMEEILNRVARFSETQSIKIINCDSASTEVAIVRDLNDFEIIGGGGTDMRVGIKAAAELKPRVDIIMTITDGFTPWPKEPPADNPYATYIVLLVGNARARRVNPPEWMTSVEVKIPQKRSGLRM